MTVETAYQEFGNLLHASNSAWGSQRFGEAMPGLLQDVASRLAYAVTDDEILFLDSSVHLDSGEINVFALTGMLVVHLEASSSSRPSVTEWRRDRITTVVLTSSPLVASDPRVWNENRIECTAAYENTKTFTFPLEPGNRSQDFGTLYWQLQADLEHNSWSAQ